MQQILAGKSLDTKLRQLISKYLEKNKAERKTNTAGSEPVISYFVGILPEEASIIKIASLKEKDEHIGASMIKVLILECLFQQARLEKLDLQEVVPLTEVPRVEGGGALQELFSYHKFSLLELSRLMMTLSDNWATNILIHKLGMDTINERAQELGLPDLKLERIMMDAKARFGGKENRITALSMAKLYEYLYKLREESLYGIEMWNILGRQQFRDKIPFFWGEEVPFYHKTGSLEYVEHDGGIYITLLGAYVIIILVSGLSNGLGIQLGAEMGKEIREFIDFSLPPLEETIIQDI